MKKFRILSLVLALMLIVPVIAACDSGKKGDPYNYTVTVVTTVELDADNNPVFSTGEEDEDYEDILRAATTVTVYSETGEITLGDVITEYLNMTNNDYYFDEGTNRYTKIDGVSAQRSAGTGWDFQIDGTSTALSTVIPADTEITLVYGK